MKNKNIDFKYLYKRQLEFQNILGNEDIPKDDPELFSHHMLGMITEIGEALQEDKRWKKNKRNEYFNKINKIEEISDIFIFMLNILIYSDISEEEILNSVDKKITLNINRYFDKEFEKEV